MMMDGWVGWNQILPQLDRGLKVVDDVAETAMASVSFRVVESGCGSSCVVSEAKREGTRRHWMQMVAARQPHCRSLLVGSGRKVGSPKILLTSVIDL